MRVLSTSHNIQLRTWRRSSSIVLSFQYFSGIFSFSLPSFCVSQIRNFASYLIDIGFSNPREYYEMDEFFSVDNLQRLKLIVHCTQAVFIFIAWCIMIGFFRNAVVVTGASGWYFALVCSFLFWPAFSADELQCFLTVPVIIYQTMTPMWERSRRWGNPYAFAIIDLVYTILWLSAFAAVANINTWGLCFGACDLSKAEVGLGFFIL